MSEAESKETPPSDGVFLPEFKPDNRTKEQKLARIRPPKDAPDEIEFNAYVEAHCMGVGNYRPDLYHELCLHKWHNWQQQRNRWVRIRDWRKYVSALEDKILPA
jgi:hypothetical protein